MCERGDCPFQTVNTEQSTYFKNEKTILKMNKLLY